ncbi:hypothetical protein AB0E96_10355 [Kitasatospora sp. NPDC036755]
MRERSNGMGRWLDLVEYALARAPGEVAAHEAYREIVTCTPRIEVFCNDL